MDTINQVTDETACIDVDSLYWSTVLEYSDYRYNNERIIKVQYVSTKRTKHWVIVTYSKSVHVTGDTPVQHKDYANWVNKK